MMMIEKDFELVSVLQPVVFIEEICPARSTEICLDHLVGDCNDVTPQGIMVRFQSDLKHGRFIDTSMTMVHEVTSSTAGD